MDTSNRHYTIDDLENLLENLPYEVWLKDKCGKYIYINKLGAQKIGTSKEDIIGKTDFEIRDYEVAKLIEDNTNYSVKNFTVNSDREVYGGTAIETISNKNLQEKVEDIISKYFINGNTSENNTKLFNEILKSIKSFIKCDDIEIFRYDKANNLFVLYNGESYNNISNDKMIKLSTDFSKVTSTLDNNLELEKQLKEEIKTSISKEEEFNNLYEIQLIKYGKEIAGFAKVMYDKPQNNKSIRDYEFLNEMYKKIFIATRYSNITENAYIQDLKKEYIKESLEIEKMKDDFFSNISHEFRTPLNMIISIIQLMLKKVEINEIDEESLKRNLKILRQNSYRLLRIVNNVIDTVKIKNDFYDMKIKNNNIVEVVEEIVQSTVEYVESKNRSIIFDTSNEEIILAFDDEKMERIILNLISNAIKYSKVNTQIEVKVYLEDNIDDKVFISVRNHSENKLNEYNDKIFTKFTQGEELYTRKTEGSGIGLFIVKRMIEAHNGSIWFNNIDEDIIEFKFYIPITKTEENNTSEERLDKSYRVERCNIEFSDIYD